MKAITVAELISRLQEQDQSLYVALADWNENYGLPSRNAAADPVCVQEVREWNREKIDYDRHQCVVLGQNG